MLTPEQQQKIHVPLTLELCGFTFMWIFFYSKLTVINNLQLVDSMIAELRIWRADYKLHADFQLGQRVSDPIPCIVEGSTLLKS